jgi:hypothetical protein
MKKLLIFALLILAAVFFVACVSADEDYSNDSTPEQEQLSEEEEHLRRWSADIEQFRAHIVRWHPRFANNSINARDYNLSIRETFDADVDALLLEIEGLSDFEIQVRMQYIVALLRDNHFFFTGFAGYNAALRLNRYPLMFGHFEDGFYLFRAYADFAHALNLRLIAVNGVPVQEVFDEFSRFWSVENIYDARYQFAALLNATTVLRAIGISDGEQVIYTFEDGVEITVTESHTWERLMTTIRWLPSVPLEDARAPGDLPLFHQNIRQNLWHEFLPEYGILYVIIRGWVPDTQGVFARAVRNTFDGNDVSAVIIDARGNPGGDANQFNDLFSHFAQNLPEDRLFYFINEGSNSGSVGAAFFLENINAVIIGQPAAQNSDFYWFGSSATRLFLEYSRLEITPPPTFWSALAVHRREPSDGIFRPHVLINYTIDDWINNRDPFFDYVIERMAPGL